LEVDPYGNIKNWPKDFFGDFVTQEYPMPKTIDWMYDRKG